MNSPGSMWKWRTNRLTVKQKVKTMGICQIPSLQWIDIQWSNDISEPLTSNCPPGQNLITNASHRQNVTWAVATNNLKPQPEKKKKACSWKVVAGSGISILCTYFIQRPPGPIQRDAIQLCKGQRQFGYEQATKCIEVAQNGKYWSYFNLN